MSEQTDANKRISSKLDIAYPDFTKLPESVKQKYDSLPTVVNIFRMLGYRSGNRSRSVMQMLEHTLGGIMRYSISTGGPNDGREEAN